MGIFDWFRGPPPITDRAALVDFLDTRAAFLSQKSIWDYARGRSGPYFTLIVKEKVFNDGVEVARWKNYPHGLSMVAEMVHGALMPTVRASVPLAHTLREAALDAFDRYPVPAALGSEQWAQARKDLAVRIDQVALHPTKMVKDIPLPFAQVFFDNMPIHEKLRANDFELIQAQLRLNLLNMQRDFLKAADLPALAADLKNSDNRATA
jgi:hypothetical protein